MLKKYLRVLSETKSLFKIMMRLLSDSSKDVSIVIWLGKYVRDLNGVCFLVTENPLVKTS